MKRFLLSGIMLLSLGCTIATAQSSNAYDDDIYYSSEQARADAQREAQQRKDDKLRQENNDSYSGSGDNYQSRDGAYDNGNSDDYIDYEDDYYYASHINRFNYPFYSRGYYSGYYNPYWYDRTWVDPTWGYNPWQPSFSLSFGYGPYWSSGWGYNAWYGYSPFYSYYSYPYYGGYGGYYGCGSPYYSGYWNGYYSGVYGSGNGYRNTSYGPRYSLNSVHNTIIHNNSLGHRSPLIGNSTGISNYSNGGLNAGPRNGFRGGNSALNNSTQTTTRNPSSIDRNTVQADAATANPVRDHSGYNNGRVDNSNDVRAEAPVRTNTPRNYSSDNQAVTPRSDRRGGFFGGWGRSDAQTNTPRAETPRQQPQRTEASPRSENRGYAQPRTEAPRMEQRTYTQPRTESAPSRSFGGGNSGSSRSFGGGNNNSNSGGGGGGRSFGGRR